MAAHPTLNPVICQQVLVPPLSQLCWHWIYTREVTCGSSCKGPILVWVIGGDALMIEGGQVTVRIWSGSIFSSVLVSLDGAHSPLLCSQAHICVCCKNRPDRLSQRELVLTQGPFSCQLFTVGHKHFGQCKNLGCSVGCVWTVDPGGIERKVCQSLQVFFRHLLA